jgi:hypothetical protein
VDVEVLVAVDWADDEEVEGDIEELVTDEDSGEFVELELWEDEDEALDMAELLLELEPRFTGELVTREEDGEYEANIVSDKRFYGHEGLGIAEMVLKPDEDALEAALVLDNVIVPLEFCTVIEVTAELDVLQVLPESWPQNWTFHDTVDCTHWKPETEVGKFGQGIVGHMERDIAKMISE